MPQVSSSTDESILKQGRIHWGVIAHPTAIALGVMAVFATLYSIQFLLLDRLMGSSVFKVGSPMLGAMLSYMLGGALLLAIPFNLVQLAAYLQSQVTLTTHRIIYRTGFIFRYTAEIPLAKVEFLSLYEPLLGRLLGYGTVTIRGAGGSVFNLRHIGAARDFHAVLQRAMQRSQGLPLSRPLPASAPAGPRATVPTATAARWPAPASPPSVASPTASVRPPAPAWRPSPAPIPSKPPPSRPLPAQPIPPKPTPPPDDDSRFWPKG